MKKPNDADLNYEFLFSLMLWELQSTSGGNEITNDGGIIGY